MIMQNLDNGPFKKTLKQPNQIAVRSEAQLTNDVHKQTLLFGNSSGASFKKSIDKLLKFCKKFDSNFKYNFRSVL